VVCAVYDSNVQQIHKTLTCRQKIGEHVNHPSFVDISGQMLGGGVVLARWFDQHS